MNTYVRPEADALVFTGSTGAPLRRSRFRQGWWLPAVAAAGLNGLRFHDYADVGTITIYVTRSWR
jgi:hypothetical protein